METDERKRTGRGRVLVDGEVHHATWFEPERAAFVLSCDQKDVRGPSSVIAITQDPLTCPRCRRWMRKQMRV